MNSLQALPRDHVCTGMNKLIEMVGLTLVSTAAGALVAAFLMAIVVG